ncbi:MAG: hypothetical protein AAFO29_12170 [Actinomycetota bacterium]
MEATLTLDQAGQQLGVGDDALSRLIRMGALPEARQEAGPDGPTWVIPERALPSLAARNGWTIDLRGPRAVVSAGPATPDLAPGHELVPSGEMSPAAPSDAGDQLAPMADPAPGAPSVTEVIDLALLDRLLGAQEQKTMAEHQVRETRNALSALNQTHNRTTNELEVERHERLVVADRYREERMARAASDAKVTELRNRVTREMALAEAERQARAEAMDRTARAEREAANAFASMGWLARRRFRRLSTSG